MTEPNTEAQGRNEEVERPRGARSRRGSGRATPRAARNNVERPRGAVGRRGAGRATPRAARNNDNTNVTLPLPRDLSPVPRPNEDNTNVTLPLPRDLSPVPRQDEDLSTEQQRYEMAGTPTVQFRASTPVQQETAVVDINTAAVICLNDTTENNIGEIADFIPDVLPVADTRIPTSLSDMKDVIGSHRADFISSDVENPLLMEVRRDFVMLDALSYIRIAQDDLNRPLHISFINEDGVDLGGLRREFWSIFVHQIGHSIFVTGKPGSVTFRKNYMERKKNTFFYMGQLVALSILEDGPGLPIFSEAVTDYILEESIKGLHLNDLSEVVRKKLNEMDNCTSDDIVKQIYNTMEEERSDVDFLVPGLKFCREMISSFKSALVEHQVSSCKEELDQFIRGLNTHQVLGLLRQEENRTKVRGLFSGQVRPLTVIGLRNLLNFKYSEGNSRLGEMKTGHGFLTFLQAASKKTDSKAHVNGIVVSLEDILMWLSGARSIPATGFHKKIDVDFSNAVQVNTCALSLTLKIEENMNPDEAVVHYAGLLINSQTFTME